MVYKCIVRDCEEATKIYSLPADREVRKIWLERCGAPERDYIENLSSHNRKVCPKHFTEACIGLKGLKKFALPSLYMPDYVPTGTVQDNFCFPPRPPAKQVSTRLEKVEEMLIMPSTSTLGEFSPIAKVRTPTKTYLKKQVPNLDHLDAMIASTNYDVGACAGISNKEQHMADQNLGVVDGRDVRKSPASGSKKRQKAVSIKKKLMKLQGATAGKEAQERLRDLLEESDDLCEFLGRTNSMWLKMFASNLLNTGKKPRGRTFTTDVKIFALSLYKLSSRAYHFLAKYFSLPSRNSLSNMLNRVPFLPGINPAIFSHLRTSVDKLKEEDRKCVLMFDEVSLKPRLRYNQRFDCVEGFVDLGSGKRRLQFADHAIVFMIKGVRTAWKQPIFFGFCEGTTPTSDLVHCIKTIIVQLQEIGLIVIATICDQGSTNRAAINSLSKTVRGGPQLYSLGGQEIVHLYDPPHLLKGVRNGLLTKDLRFTINGEPKLASWSHVLKFYEIDQQQGPFVQCPRLTDEHVLPNKIRKMKVKNASQVFSHTLASAMKARVDGTKDAQLETSHPRYLDPQAEDTAYLLEFFDKLFDSVNGVLRRAPIGKPLLCVVSELSSHKSFWQSAIPILSSMAFVAKEALPFTQSSAQPQTPSLKHWITTVHGFLYLTEKLLGLVEYFPPRTFNQDPLENFFSQIRSHAYGEANCSSFINSFRALLVSGFASPRSIGANCEEDVSTGALTTLRMFVEEDIVVELVQATGEISSSEVPEALCEDFASAYVAGAVLRRFFREFSCNSCAELLISSQELPQSLRRRQFEGHHLVNPCEIFTYVLNQVTVGILEILPSIIHKYGLKNIILTELKNKNYKFLLCDAHMEEKQVDLFNIIINVVVFNYIKKANRVLKGIDLRLIQSDELFKKAHIKYQKYRRVAP